eukprot:CAMPEP_0171227202 /NCGR_PEP_ID=MMETSP0790-20130122/37718_1 /TAXON_ID=2925 /ORGANISM="Alexandrium catenella, Strain OF101" /LENGTH=132 /DNA_ID=CAMNT_0011693293 /DNA_START=39 /DNA_END=435 /DNA_ORIENTATION=-
MEENSGLASFLRGVAAERRTQGRQSNNPASYLEFAPPPQAKLQDWKLDDGRVSYVKDGIRFVTSRDGEGPDHEIKAGGGSPESSTSCTTASATTTWPTGATTSGAGCGGLKWWGTTSARGLGCPAIARDACV